MSILATPRPAILYPESDGKPMADNTKQLHWIINLVGNLESLYAADPEVFVGGNQLWYPVEGEPTICQAPDAYVVFGRPKGDRASYKQWEENDIPMTIVFEVLSPGNRVPEMINKFHFYDEYGVEEYYIYDPESNSFWGYVRGRATLAPLPRGKQYTSPRLKIRFDLSGPEMVVWRPDGRPFLSLSEEQAARRQAELSLARVLELSRKLRLGQATPDELAELERLDAP